MNSGERPWQFQRLLAGATPTDTDTHGIQLAEGALYLWSLSLIIRSFSITDKDFWHKFMRKLLQL